MAVLFVCVIYKRLVFPYTYKTTYIFSCCDDFIEAYIYKKKEPFH